MKTLSPQLHPFQHLGAVKGHSTQRQDDRAIALAKKHGWTLAEKT